MSGPNAKFANDPAAQAFLNYADVRREALRRKNLRFPPYLRLTTSHQRRADARTLAMMKRDNLVLKGAGFSLLQRSTKTGNDQVTLRFCEDDDEAAFVNVKTGKKAFPVRNRWIAYEVRVVRQGDVWKVHNLGLAKFECKGELRP